MAGKFEFNVRNKKTVLKFYIFSIMKTNYRDTRTTSFDLQRRFRTLSKTKLFEKIYDIFSKKPYLDA